MRLHTLGTANKQPSRKAIVNALANEWSGVRLRKWNAERPLIFAACVLHRSVSVIGAKAIKQTIMHRLDLWEAGRFNALVHELRVDASSGWDSGEKEEWWDDGVSDSVEKNITIWYCRESCVQLCGMQPTVGRGDP